MRIAIQGIAGSFHHEAASNYFADESFELEECLDFPTVFTAVQEGNADYGIVAVENSLHGPINQVYRLLAEQKLWVAGEVRLHIAMCLIGANKQAISGLDQTTTTVSSHFAALAQCEGWLARHLPHAVIKEAPDTALAVRDIVQSDTPNNFAIAGQHAADMYGGAIIAKNINDDPENYTRFFVISKDEQPEPRANRTSIILHENSSDRAGLLYEALGIFNTAGVNLSKLDSHPKPGAQRTYAFYIDFDIGAHTKAAETILNQLQAHGWTVQILGSYLANDQPAEV
mgnify:CR=1 FL=1